MTLNFEQAVLLFEFRLWPHHVASCVQLYTIIYARQEINYSSCGEHSTFSIGTSGQTESSLLCEFFYDTDEETKDSSDSALDEIMSSFLHGFLVVCTIF